MGTRTLFLVRHGQYDASDDGSLTNVGRKQAAHTAAWLLERLGDEPIHAVWASTLVRAEQTAQILAERAGLSVRLASTLREGIYSRIDGHETTEEERAIDRERADAAYARFFRPSKSDRNDVLVCHGNLIRYLVCRAMDVPAGRWTRMNSNHCGVTHVLVRDTGIVRVVSYNQTAHLSNDLVT